MTTVIYKYFTELFHNSESVSSLTSRTQFNFLDFSAKNTNPCASRDISDPVKMYDEPEV